MKEPLISVIMTTFERSPVMVERAISSVLNQTHKNLEIIIIDDSPVAYKKRKEVAAKINLINDNRITYIQHKENTGACVARNTGIKRSKGDFIIYFDDDDELLPNKIKYSLKKFHSKEVGLVYSQHFTIDEFKNKNESKNKMYSGYIFDKLIKHNFVAAFPLIRRDCFVNCGLFDPKMQSMQDYELWLRIAQRYKFEYVNKPLSIVYKHEGERISTDTGKKIQGAEEIYKRYQFYFNKHKNAKNIKLKNLALIYIRDGQTIKALKISIKVLMRSPFTFYSNFKYIYRFTREVIK